MDPKRKTALLRVSMWIFALGGFARILGIDIRPEIEKYCREKERLITSEELDEYLLVDAEMNSTLLMACHFCNEPDDKQPKIWYRQDRYQSEPEAEVELGMDNNMSHNRIHTSTDFSLVIREFAPADAAIYRCHGEAGRDMEHKFNYRLEVVYKVDDDVPMGRGNISDWEKYRETNLEPVTNRFAVSRMSDLQEIRESGIILELVSEWTPWSPCERCIRKRGFKTSRAQCRIKRRIETQNTSVSNDSLVIKFFSKSPLLPCRSHLLAEEFPSISRATRDLPEFILEEKCKNCPRVKKTKKDKFKYKKRYTLAQGAHLAIVCPDVFAPAFCPKFNHVHYIRSSLESQVVWRKDALILKKGLGRSFRKKDAEPRVLVDTFSTLYLIDVSSDEEGNYTCYADNVKMMQVRIRVVSKSRLLSQAFFRHMGYLGFIFLLTSFCYCGGLFVVCREKDKFKIKDYKEIEND